MMIYLFRMVIWINGAFGVGKTTLAKALSKHLKKSLIFDPERIGFFLKASNDFQDVRHWRTLTGLISGFLGRHSNGHVIVPMTVTNPAYLDEIFRRISMRGVKVLHFFLELNGEDLRARIESHRPKRRSEMNRKWRLSQLRRCLDAKAAMPSQTIFLSALKSTEDLIVDVEGYL